MDDYINEQFLDMILSEYPNAAEDIFFGDDEDAPSSLLFNAVTIAKFPGIRIDLLIIRDDNDKEQ